MHELYVYLHKSRCMQVVCKSTCVCKCITWGHASSFRLHLLSPLLLLLLLFFFFFVSEESFVTPVRTASIHRLSFAFSPLPPSLFSLPLFQIWALPTSLRSLFFFCFLSFSFLILATPSLVLSKWWVLHSLSAPLIELPWQSSSATERGKKEVALGRWGEEGANERDCQKRQKRERDEQNQRTENIKWRKQTLKEEDEMRWAVNLTNRWEMSMKTRGCFCAKAFPVNASLFQSKMIFLSVKKKQISKTCNL